jgi:F-type H+-transporting ATPase subunit beta
MAQLEGEVIQIIGPVLDISFERAGNELPDIHEALEVTRDDGSTVVNAIAYRGRFNPGGAMDSTDRLRGRRQKRWQLTACRLRTDPWCC